MIENQIKSEELGAAIIAGNALITFTSLKTQKYLTFLIKKNEASDGSVTYSVVHGELPVGTLFPSLKFVPKVLVGKRNEQQVLAFSWIWKNTLNPNRLDKFIIAQHNGKCVRCGRKLTTPDSIKEGYGPECIKLKNFSV